MHEIGDWNDPGASDLCIKSAINWVMHGFMGVDFIASRLWPSQMVYVSSLDARLQQSNLSTSGISTHACLLYVSVPVYVSVSVYLSTSINLYTLTDAVNS